MGLTGNNEIYKIVGDYKVKKIKNLTKLCIGKGMRVKMKKNKGITLIALVVTIIVLLILAGISISVLTGDNGLIKKAVLVNTENAYGGAQEQVRMAYTAVKLEIKTKIAKDGNYDPTRTGNTIRLANMVRKDLGLGENVETNETWTVDDTIPGIIKIEYKDPKIDQGVMGSTSLTKLNEEIEEVAIPRNKGKVIYQITLKKNGDAKLYEDIEENTAEINENIYATLYNDGTLVFDNCPDTIQGKVLEEGTETWNITGLSFDFSNNSPWNAKREKIKKVDFLNNIFPRSTKTWFWGCNNLERIDNISKLVTKNVTDMSAMFELCSKLKNLDVSDFNTKNVTDMSWMFAYCETLENLNLEGINTSNVTNMYEMFSLCKKLKEIDVSNFDTSKVENMNGIFYGCYEVESININNFVIKDNCDISHMFANCLLLKDIYAEKTAFENKGDLSDLFVGSATNVITSPTNGIVFGYTIRKNLGWYVGSDSYVLRSARQDRASSDKIYLNPNKKYRITMNSENFDFGCINNPKTYDSGWIRPGSITIENYECIVLNFGYQRAHTGTITDAMLEEIINNIEIKVIQ